MSGDHSQFKNPHQWHDSLLLLIFSQLIVANLNAKWQEADPVTLLKKSVWKG